jgi:dolichol-phosphate mannosyltransferase
MSIAIVIPTYNEAANIGALLNRILAVGPEYCAIVVDDNSPDGTADVVRAIAAKEPRVHLILRTTDKGFGLAVRAGFARALETDAELIGQMDADGSHDPQVFEALRAVIEAGEADGMIGSRYLAASEIQGWNLHRHANSRVANTLTKWIARLPIADATNGLRLFRRDVLEAIDLDRLQSRGYSVILETNYCAHRLGFRLGERPITFHPRAAGESKLGMREVLRFLRFLLALRFRSVPGIANPRTARLRIPAG